MPRSAADPQAASFSAAACTRPPQDHLVNPRFPHRRLWSRIAFGAWLAAFGAIDAMAQTPPAAVPAVATISGMPPVSDANNLYSDAAAGRMSGAVADALPRIYVPNLRSNDVYVIDPATMKV